MDIPTFYPGETLSSEKLNRLADALRELAEECRANRITDVANGTFERSSAGTTLAFPSPQKKRATSAPAPYIPPFAVSIDEEGCVRVAPGMTYSTSIDRETAASPCVEPMFYENAFPLGKAFEGACVCIEDFYPTGRGVFMTESVREKPHVVIIAEIVKDGNGSLAVRQYLRSDVFFTK
ncbi:MAG: hypothetical protein E7037_08160 [Verrucomicrobia bacterium]|nr:hypothetical protein [Verrucomicrobiota bacterium]